MSPTPTPTPSPTSVEGEFGFFRREQRSLFGEILDWMLTPLLLLWPLSLGLTWVVAQNIASKPFDRALEYNLNALSQYVETKAGTTQLILSPQARDILRADDTDLTYYQLMEPIHGLISGEEDLPIPKESDITTGSITLRDDVVRGDHVRVAYLWLDRGVQRPVLLQLAETKSKRSTLAAEIIKGVMVPQFILLPLAVLLVWWALVRGIRPLNELELRIRARRPDDLSPIEERYVPHEVAPLVDSINDLLSRLTGSLSTQKRFLADAAHQLKTPLAGLRMQAEFAARQTQAQEIKDSLNQIATSSIRAAHTVNQLLALARAETTGRSVPSQAIHMPDLVQATIQDQVPRALERGIDLGYDAPPVIPGGGNIQGNPTLLQEMLRNLVENALYYVGEGGVVTVRLMANAFSSILVLQVEDNGPGIPIHERELVLAPFYRILGTGVDGSGLGLAIVQEIAHQHHAELELSDSFPHAERPGLRVSIRFKMITG